MKGALMSVSDQLLLRNRTIIETINDELRRHRNYFSLRRLAFISCFFRSKVRQGNTDEWYLSVYIPQRPDIGNQG